MGPIQCFKYRITARNLMLMAILLFFSLMMATFSSSLAYHIAVFRKGNWPVVLILIAFSAGIAAYLLRNLYGIWNRSFSFRNIVLDEKERTIRLIDRSRELVFQLPESVKALYKDNEQYEITLCKYGKEYMVSSKNVVERQVFETALDRILPDFPAPTDEKFAMWQRKQ